MHRVAKHCLSPLPLIYIYLCTHRALTLYIGLAIESDLNKIYGIEVEFFFFILPKMTDLTDKMVLASVDMTTQHSGDTKFT